MDAKRDWGHAADYVEAMWLMLQAPAADDFVVATGETHSVREFCQVAFERAGLPLTWQGTAESERGIGPDGRIRVAVDPQYFRPAEVDLLLGDPSKAKATLGWAPKVTFRALAERMADHDLELARVEKKTREA